jgi:hypothetical protein
VALTKRLPSLSNYLATDVSAWAWHMTIVRDNNLWRETDAESWDDYCTRVVGKPLDWCRWIIGGYEALSDVRPGPIHEVEALAAGKAADRVMAAAGATTGDVLLAHRPKLDESMQIAHLSADERAANSNISLRTQRKLDRLARERPDLLADVRGGRLSAHSAAIAAGIVKPPDALRIAQRLWTKMTPEDRDAFEDFIADWRRGCTEETVR